MEFGEKWIYEIWKERCNHRYITYIGQMTAHICLPVYPVSHWQVKFRCPSIQVPWLQSTPVQSSTLRVQSSPWKR